MATSPKKIRSLEDLVEEARWGKLTQNELDYVVQRIKSIDPDTASNDEGWDLVSLIYILGRSGADQYRQLVEKFLHFRSNEMVCAKALQTLFDYWQFTEEYLDDVKLYIRGVEWDWTDDVRTMATNQIKDTADYKRYLVQASAYSAIARAMVKSYDEID